LVDVVGALNMTVNLLQGYDVGVTNRFSNTREIETAILTEGVLNVVGHEFHM
jgi:hypothetical protein